MPDQFSDSPWVVLKNWKTLPSGSGRPLHWYWISSKFLLLPSESSVAASTSLIFIVMPASPSWACITSASWTLIGMLLVVSVNVKPLGWPPSASFALTLARSRFSGGMLLSYAQLEGGIGPFEATPTPSQTPLTICSMSSPETTAWRRALLLNGGLVWFIT